VSLSLRDRLLVEFGPQRLQLRRYAAGWRGGRLLADQRVDCGAGDEAEAAWAPALAALRATLPDPRWAGTQVAVQLSNHFVRYLTIAWDERLVTGEEQLAMVRHAFVQAHGAAAENWSFRWDVAPAPAPCFACAIDSALLAGVRDACAGATLRLASIQPQLMSAFNAARDMLPAHHNCWFLVEEVGRICLAWVHADTLTALYSQRVGDDWTSELPGLLERAVLLAAGSAPGAVYLWLTTAKAVATELPSGWSLHLLPAVPSTGA